MRCAMSPSPQWYSCWCPCHRYFPRALPAICGATFGLPVVGQGRDILAPACSSTDSSRGSRCPLPLRGGCWASMPSMYSSSAGRAEEGAGGHWGELNVKLLFGEAGEGGWRRRALGPHPVANQGRDVSRSSTDSSRPVMSVPVRVGCIGG